MTVQSHVNAAPSPPRPTDYPKQCDLVLKGGITSGVVYPGAIASFAAHYDFKQIGGTSAGAIAAAAAAAAQLGRLTRSDGEPDPFARLANLPQELGARQSNGRSALFGLFQPSPTAKRLFNTATAAAGGGWKAAPRVLGHALLSYPLAALLGVLPAVLWCVVSPWSASSIGISVQCVVLLVVLIVGVLLALLAALLRNAAHVLPDQGWGMCPGVVRRADGREEPTALSSWLHVYLNTLAGLDASAVLTFRHFWQGLREPTAAEVPPDQRAISFKAMTTALNLERPFIVPFEGRDAQDLYFRDEDLRAVLPNIVVDHMVRASKSIPPPTYATHRAAFERYSAQGYLRVPLAEDLPVLLAVRLSLSFPILLTAVRFYKPDYTLADDDEMQPLWFSDGGICSNLPVHLFDAPIPTHPTFTINLVEPLPSTAKAKYRDEVVFVSANAHSGQEGPRNYFHQAKGLAGIAAFLMEIVDSARNWVDNGQLRLPGYRERVGSVVVKDDEGGLNLDMDPAIINSLSQRGTQVAEDLDTLFSTKGGTGDVTGWQRHQWVRLRNQLGALSSHFRDSCSALTKLGDKLDDLQKMVDEHPGTLTDEDRSPEQRQALRDFLAALEPVLSSPSIQAIIDKSEGALSLRARE